ncbi:hypothetical protein F1C10_12010 [Sphingomonas sp. NBWT7]|uniref:hypothetical protein n=1 Tax=Sphingomonas sp. NBWT7 TaxID=2596913 RepID=UPI0016246E63|nr:hypothetical protein [Sphingomonas sp. NBWT7]QNE32596.1 hypothetical protein F1C10_12010 [Sphingomonas sp. NBWT7]
MLVLAAILAVVAPADNQPKAELELNAADRRALVIGLERRVGGKFVLTGIKDAERACQTAHSCITDEALLAAARHGAPVNAVRTIDQLLASSDVSGETPVAIVSARSARWKGDNLIVRTSVYDKAGGRWMAREATIAQFPGVIAPVRTLLSWQSVD